MIFRNSIGAELQGNMLWESVQCSRESNILIGETFQYSQFGIHTMQYTETILKCSDMVVSQL